MTAASATPVPEPRPVPTPADHTGELAGFTVAVTSDRRRDELAALLQARGARVVLAAAVRLVPVADDDVLRDVTHRLLESPPDAVVANTAVGLLGWMEAADGWGLGDALRERLAAAQIVARWPQAARDLRSAGLLRAWSPETESSTEIFEHLATHRGPRASGARPLSGLRIAVQLQGEPQEELRGLLAAAGAEVIAVPVYRSAPPADPAPLQRLIDLITNHLVDAVTFTSAVAVGSVLRAAGPNIEAVLAALRGPVLVGCIGPKAADPLHRAGVPVLAPARARVSALAAALVEALPRRTQTLHVAGCELVLRGHAAVVDGTLKPLPPAQMAILRSLAAAPGRVLPRSELLASLPRGADEHAVEMAVARLRAALGRPSLIQTVVKRGYRLRSD
jgi:uroporphyrinogen-III synthase